MSCCPLRKSTQYHEALDDRFQGNRSTLGWGMMCFDSIGQHRSAGMQCESSRMIEATSWITIMMLLSMSPGSTNSGSNTQSLLFSGTTEIWPRFAFERWGSSRHSAFVVAVCFICCTRGLHCSHFDPVLPLCWHACSLGVNI